MNKFENFNNQEAVDYLRLNNSDRFNKFPKRLRLNQFVALEAVDQDFNNIRFIDEDLVLDKEFIVKAAIRNGWIVSSLSKVLLDDISFMTKIGSLGSQQYNQVPDNFKKDKDFFLNCFHKMSDSEGGSFNLGLLEMIRFAPSSLMSDPDFVKVVYVKSIRSSKPDQI